MINKYNELLEKQKKAANWMDKATEEQQEKHFKRYKNILLELESTREVLNTRGYIATLKGVM